MLYGSVVLTTIKSPIKTKNNKNGNNTKNHETSLYPALHIEFNMNVQNKTYIPCPKNIIAVLSTLHSYAPTQNLFVFPVF